MACNLTEFKKIIPLIPQTCERADLTTDHILILIYKAFVLLSWASEVAAILLLVWAGILYFMAASDEAKATTAKKIVIGVIIGLIIIFMARWILYIITEKVGEHSNDIDINTLTNTSIP